MTKPPPPAPPAPAPAAPAQCMHAHTFNFSDSFQHRIHGQRHAGVWGASAGRSYGSLGMDWPGDHAAHGNYMSSAPNSSCCCSELTTSECPVGTAATGVVPERAAHNHAHPLHTQRVGPHILNTENSPKRWNWLQPKHTSMISQPCVSVARAAMRKHV